MCAAPYQKAVSGNNYKNNGGFMLSGGNTDSRISTADYLGVRAKLSSAVFDSGIVDKAVSANALAENGGGGTTYVVRNYSPSTILIPGSDVSKLRDYPYKLTDRTTRIYRPPSAPTVSGGYNYSTGLPIQPLPIESSLDTQSSETLPTRAIPGTNQMMTGGKLPFETNYPAKTT